MADADFCVCSQEWNRVSGRRTQASLVMHLSYGTFSMLLTGDVKEKVAELLCQSGKLSEITVLKTAHHGSEHSTPEQFLEQTKPKLALISAGIENVYGHPHPKLLERLKSFGIPVYNTAKSGSINSENRWKKNYNRSISLKLICNQMIVDDTSNTHVQIRAQLFKRNWIIM